MEILGLVWWEALAAAAFAPLAVWLLWRLQTATVEVLRRTLVKLVRYHGWLYSIVSWFGTFIHELSHAAVLLLSGHGIKEFRAGVEEGHVLPRRLRTGPLGFLFFAAAALAPLFIPPALLLGATWLLLDERLLTFDAAGPGLQAALDVLVATFATFPKELALAVARLDLATPAGIAFALLALVALPSSKPSFVKGKGGSRFHREGDEGDIAVLRRRLRANPWPFLGFLAVLYALYFALVPWAPTAYWAPFQVVWAIALTGAVLSLASAALWGLVAFTGRIHWLVQWIPLAAFVALQVLGRPALDDLMLVNAVSLLAAAGTALSLGLVARKRDPYARF
ncbi:MAG: hypothetical protein ACPGQL_04165 [Thermoplasmatota archaeon]